MLQSLPVRTRKNLTRKQKEVRKFQTLADRRTILETALRIARHIGLDPIMRSLDNCQKDEVNSGADDYSSVGQQIDPLDG